MDRVGSSATVRSCIDGGCVVLSLIGDLTTPANERPSINELVSELSSICEMD